MNVYLAEFFGTALLLLMGGGVVANVALKKTNGSGADWIVITVGWGLGVTLGVYAVGQISGAHLNPAVTLALAINGDFPWSQVPGYMIAQLIGGVFGGMLTWLMYLPHWRATEDEATKLGVFATGPALKNYTANFISEIIGTAVLTSGLLYIGANKFTEGLNPLIVGALIVAIGLSLGGTTGYAINPARDLGPRIAHAILPITGKGGSGWGYAIVPILGPMVGGMLGTVIYRLAFKGIFDVWTVVTLIALVLTLLLGVALNKKSPQEEIAKI
ncbi:MIP/aquaporin family protein [Staphylococcus intermedius]|uniref:Glycerol uptake facilitator protein n=1 Tax=Staphylococcus intermedius NCTC 11048 TaxID=1141106 RepID=A0A380G725_STAIN|nr:MIP/aquaporin family protein [Staphylococcus intermedius]PCF65021.1 aquaporin [Staphylococcus intermedius]PCF80632.1 aquaporin [Staphylococcus intermedius]PCF81981.1 aquaporin [Staphylococcus intermedius]PCF88317.1 aquaporin [Staphylococcus intermedius]PCF89032.1 aquaporin [Staphylococcus intermedius]